MSTETRRSLRTRIAEVTKLRQHAKTAAEQERYTCELIELMNAVNRKMSARKEEALRALLRKKKPSKAEIESGLLLKLRRYLQETFEIQQQNESKARRLYVRAGNTIDDSNIGLHLQVKNLLREGNVVARLRLRKLVKS